MSDYSKNHLSDATFLPSGGGLAGEPATRAQGGSLAPHPDLSEGRSGQAFAIPHGSPQPALEASFRGAIDEPLGNTAKFSSPPPSPDPILEVWSRRIHRFYLQSMARRILLNERVERVGKDKIYSNPRYPVVECLRVTRNRMDAVALDWSPRNKTAHYANLRVCGRLWQCPVCSAKISEARRKELGDMVERARDMGYSTFMVTYTLSHHTGDSLGDQVKKLTAALKDFKGGKSYDNFKRTYQILGSVRALEITFGANGWHSHFHDLMISSAPPDSLHFGKITEYLKPRWVHCAAKNGFTASLERGLHVGFVQGHVDDYLAKFGRESHWTDAHEITKQTSKLSRSAGGTTPFGLLDAHADGELVFGHSPARLFLEYIEATHGRKQLFWSPGLRARFALGDEPSDDDLAEELPDDRQLAVLVDLVDWSIVARYEHRAQLKNLLEAGDGNPAGVIAFINHLRNQHLGKV